jgi:hypothetical protein
VEVTREMIENGYDVEYDGAEGDTMTVTARLRDPAGNVSESDSDTAVINATVPWFEDEQGEEVDSYAFVYDENSASGTVVGTVRAEDDGGDTVTYAIVQNVQDADGNDLYAIDEQTGEIVLTEAGAASFANDYETDGNSHRIVVTASDGVNETEVEVSLDERNLNDNAPVVAPSTVTTDEDVPYLFNTQDFHSTDADGDEIVKIRIETLPEKGALEYFDGNDWIAVNAGNEINVSDIEAGKLRFVPAQNASGDSYATFDFKAFDGEHWSEDIAGVTISVAPVADGPDLSVTLGKDLLIDTSNVTETGGGFVVKAYRADGSEGEISKNNNPSGFGVVGNDATGASSELGYNYDLGSSEKLVVSFDGLVTSAEVSLAWLNSKETAAWTFMKGGEVVGGGTHTGGSDKVDDPITLTPGKAFDTIIFHTIHNPNYEDDDYLIHSIEAEVLATDTLYAQEGQTIHLDINASLRDTDGSEELSRVEVSGLPSGAKLTDGTHEFTVDSVDTVVNVTDWNYSNMTIELPDTVAATTSMLVVEAETRESETGDTKVARQTIELNLLDSADKVFVFNGDKVEGGDGFDVLVSHENIDLSALEQDALQNIEKIDMSDGSAQTISTLTLDEVVEMTDEDNTLLIEGDRNDSVELSDEFIQSGTETIGGTTYNVYTNDGDPTVTLKIDQDVQHG